MKTVLLDVDGTLVDSNAQHAEAWSQAFKEFGLSFCSGQIFPYIGMGGEKLVAALIPDIDEEQNKKIGERRSEIFLREYASHLGATPGAHELVSALRARGHRPIIATSAHKDELKVVLQAAGISELLDSAVTSDDVERSKPDPDIVDAALKKTKTEPAGAVMVGDTPYDIEAAHRAGVRIIALLCGGRSETDLRGAEAIYRDPAELTEHLNDVAILSDEH